MSQILVLIALTTLLAGCSHYAMDEFGSTYRMVRRHPEGMARVGYKTQTQLQDRLVDRGKIVTDPSGAKVSIVEQKSGTVLLSGSSPLEYNFPDITHKVKIIIEKDGYETATRYPATMDEYGVLSAALLRESDPNK